MSNQEGQRSIPIRGFTLIEMLIVISLIAILTVAAVANYSDSRAQSRDAKRQADLRNLQSALESYKSKYGRYPEQCATSGPAANGWSGQSGTDFACTTGNQYILGTPSRPFVPEFIRALPVDPKINGTNSGYVYRTNAEGTVYKVMAMNTVESEVVTEAHVMRRCDFSEFTAGPITVRGWCSRVSVTGQPSIPAHCYSSSADYQRTYAVWGGLAPLRTSGFSGNTTGFDLFAPEPLSTFPGPDSNKFRNQAIAVYDTSQVICQ